jgi:hypothetical protein
VVGGAGVFLPEASVESPDFFEGGVQVFCYGGGGGGEEGESEAGAGSAGDGRLLLEFAMYHAGRQQWLEEEEFARQLLRLVDELAAPKKVEQSKQRERLSRETKLQWMRGQPLRELYGLLVSRISLDREDAEVLMEYLMGVLEGKERGRVTTDEAWQLLEMLKGALQRLVKSVSGDREWRLLAERLELWMVEVKERWKGGQTGNVRVVRVKDRKG